MRSSINIGRCLQHASRRSRTIDPKSPSLHIRSPPSLPISTCRLHTNAIHLNQQSTDTSNNLTQQLQTGQQLANYNPDSPRTRTSRNRPPGRTNSSFDQTRNHVPAQSYEDCDIADLREEDIGKHIAIHGYVQAVRRLASNFGFLVVLDEGSILTCLLSIEQGTQLYQAVENLKALAPVRVYGQFRYKQDGKSYNKFSFIVKTELVVEAIDVLNKGSKLLVSANTVWGTKDRHLQIRTDKRLMDGLKLRAKVASLCRNFLETRKFIEIETPLLYKSTPEGAREFIVPTRNPGMAYALPQSPQQYKQILMASGVSRYYQIAKCFRDEDMRADRQPEFTQLDLEMSFVSGREVMQIMEALIRHIWFKVLAIDIGIIPVMTYHEAISRYGTDKPDIRFGLEICDVTDCFRKSISRDFVYEAFNVKALRKPGTMESVGINHIYNKLFGPGSFDNMVQSQEQGDSNQDVVVTTTNVGPRNKAMSFATMSPEYVGDLPGMMEVVQDIELRIKAEPGHTYVVMRRPKKFAPGGSTPIGDLRKKFHQIAARQRWLPVSEKSAPGFKFLWVTDFPLFSPVTNSEDPGQGGMAGYKATHHPFTAPASQDEDLFLTEPLKCLGAHYDLVVNGWEIGGGSTRIHEAEVQEYVFRDILKIPEERLRTFDKFLDILRSGCPPHAGMAIGFDRVLALLHGSNSIRDVIAFPKSATGRDVTVGSPGRLSPEQLSEYHLQSTVSPSDIDSTPEAVESTTDLMQEETEDGRAL